MAKHDVVDRILESRQAVRVYNKVSNLDSLDWMENMMKFIRVLFYVVLKLKEAVLYLLLVAFVVALNGKVVL